MLIILSYSQANVDLQTFIYQWALWALHKKGLNKQAFIALDIIFLHILSAVDVRDQLWHYCLVEVKGLD